MNILSQDAHAGFDHISRIADFSNEPPGSSSRPISPDPTIFDKPVLSVTHSFPDLLNKLTPPHLVQEVLRVLGGSSNLPPRLQVSFVRGGGRLAKFILVEMQLAHSIGETVECPLGVSQWASQLSLVGRRPHHFDSIRTADIAARLRPITPCEAAHCVPTSPPPAPQASGLGASFDPRPLT